MKRIWKVHLQGEENHLCYKFCTLKRTNSTEAIVFSKEMKKVRLPVVLNENIQVPIMFTEDGSDFFPAEYKEIT